MIFFIRHDLQSDRFSYWCTFNSTSNNEPQLTYLLRRNCILSTSNEHRNGLNFLNRRRSPIFETHFGLESMHKEDEHNNLEELTRTKAKIRKTFSGIWSFRRSSVCLEYSWRYNIRLIHLVEIKSILCKSFL